MTTATLREKKIAEIAPCVFGLEHNGILMTPEEFDQADFDELWTYELINGVLIVSPIPSEGEVDPNEELGRWLRNYGEDHPKGKVLDSTLPERYIKAGRNRRRADRAIWIGLGRLPRKGETPAIIVEFVSRRRRDRQRDYETKREEYAKAGAREYWIIDRFALPMTVHFFGEGEIRTKALHSKQIYRTKLLPGFELPLGRLLELAAKWSAQEEEQP